MRPPVRPNVLRCFKLFDLCVGAVCFGLGAWAAHFHVSALSFADFLSVRVTVANVALFLAFFPLWHMTLAAFGLYRPARPAIPGEEVLGILKATSVATLEIAAAAMVFSLSVVQANFLAVFWALSSAILAASRTLVGHALRRRRLRSRHRGNIVVVGSNPRALQFALKITSNPALGYRLVGFADDQWASSQDPRTSLYPVVSNLKDLPAYLRTHAVDEVAICVPVKSLYEQAAQIIGQCEEQGIVVRFLPDVFKPKVGHLVVEQFEDDTVITVYTGAMSGWPSATKRVFDFVFALVLLAVLSPLLLITAALIKITSPGPVFFAQDRVGRNKHRFRLYKFRTMVVNAEQRLAELVNSQTMDGPAFKMKDDPRITPLGKILRKMSIDELPQLINVLKGDMSLVGPRPTPLKEYEGFDKDWHRRRFSVRPGITGLWQVSGRSTAPFAKRMELDMHYIDHWNLWLDLEILARTVPVVLKGEGAV